MTDYFRWSVRQIYYAFFWPTRAVREAGEKGHGGRLRYLATMLTWACVLTVLGNLAVGRACASLGVAYEWGSSWVGVWIGVWVGLCFAAVFGATFGPLGNLGTGVGVAMASSAPCVTSFGVALGATAGVAKGAGGGAAAFATPLDVTLGVALGVALGAVAVVSISGGSRLRFAVIVGVAGGVVVSTAFGVPFVLLYFRLAEYPVDIALAAAAYFVALRKKRTAAHAWRWCPVAWNELTWLPLPYVAKLLVLLVKQNREEGFRQIAFVVTERPLQRRVALAALGEVAIGDLRARSVQELASVAERLGWATDAPGGALPKGLSAALPRLDRVAQHAAQYLTLHSAYRKGEALKRGLAEIDLLQLSLVAARGDFAPKLLQVTDEWGAMLRAESEKALAWAGAARAIPNPFVYGNPVMETQHNVFAGRRDVVRQIAESLLGAAQAPTLLLQGPRRMGKTSILNQLPTLLGPDFAPVVVDCQNPAVTASEATLLRYLSRALSEGLRRRRVSVEELKAEQLAREPYAVFDEWLERVERAMPAGMRALLCLDEYERLQSALRAGWGTPFLDALRHTFQHRPRMVLMFTGSHTFQELGPAWTDRFISARRIRVSFLTREDVELLLTKPIPEFDMTYASGALDALVAVTNCHPFLTQAVAFELVELLNTGQRREATTADVEEAVGRALDSGEVYFVNVWGDAGAEGQALLRALAAGETPPDFPAARAWLHEHDVLGADGDFAVEMMRRWVVSKAASV